jgi:hypothetical protein
MLHVSSHTALLSKRSSDKRAEGLRRGAACSLQNVRKLWARGRSTAAVRRRRQQRRDERALPPSLPKQVNVAAELQGQLARGSNLLHVVGDE